MTSIRVIECSQGGPGYGMILADLGAEVVRVEPRDAGDRTRYLPGCGAGPFPAFNCNKYSVQLDIAEAADRGRALDLIDSADVLLENFRVGKMESMWHEFELLAARNPRLIYCSLKGFLSGPCGNRAALDEVVQVLGGRCAGRAPVEFYPTKQARAIETASASVAFTVARSGVPYPLIWGPESVAGAFRCLLSRAAGEPRTLLEGNEELEMLRDVTRLVLRAKMQWEKDDRGPERRVTADAGTQSDVAAAAQLVLHFPGLR